MLGETNEINHESFRVIPESVLPWQSDSLYAKDLIAAKSEQVAEQARGHCIKFLESAPKEPMTLDRRTLESQALETQASDATLWAALNQGQAEALGLLYDRHAGLVYGIALKLLKHPQDAEDLTQEIFLKLAHTRYDPRRGSLRTFLAVLARSRAIDRLRFAQRAQVSLKQWQITQSAEMAHLPPEPTDREEMTQAVAAALSQLSESQRQVLDLAYREGLSHGAIANQLNTPLGTVKSLARRGLIKLRQILQPALEEESQ